MFTYDKRRIIRLYSDGKSYVLTSQLIENQTLHIKLVDSCVCINKITNDEWMAMKQRSGINSFSLINESYGCIGILTIASDERASSYLNSLIFVKEAVSVGSIRKFDIIRITDVFILPLQAEINTYMYQQQQSNSNTKESSGQHNDVRKFLSSGNFYYAYSQEPGVSFDLTLSAQARHLGHATDKKFLWNYNFHIPFRRLNVDTDLWLLKIICGCVDIKKVFTLSKSFKACLFSRLSCDRVGTRFNCRGVNDDGNCANFVETEQVLFSEESDEESSFLQLRGSVPVFFQQTGINVGTHRLAVSRGIEACYPAFERHIKSLIQDYGTHLYILNLLGIKGDESFLTECFSRLCKESPFSMNGQLSYTNFDYHQEMKLNRHALGEKMWTNLVHEFYISNHRNNNIDDMFFYHQNQHNSCTNTATKLQSKFIRTNCMDCLDRTNNVQSYIGIEMLTYQLKDFLNENDTQKIRECREIFRQMWILNGDCISKIYAGTGAIQGRSVTQDISRSLTRAIQNNFLDNNKQDAIDTVLYGNSKNYGDLADRIRILMSQNALRLPNPVLRKMIAQNLEYSKQIKCRICIGTWNINGGLGYSEMEKLDLNEWLIDGPLLSKKTGLGYLDPNAKNLDDIDIFCVGFEEICDLSAHNIVSASDENSTQWYNKLYKFLNKHGKYVPLIIEPLQLVGVCLFVFVLDKHVSAIRDVCVARTKTGMGGAAGNKGGVLVRLVFYNTSICFVAAHFAAHQKEIQQRNDDFRQIYEKSEFVGQSMQNKIDVPSHDYVFWCGDLNYRIDMENSHCRSLISEKNWPRLLEMDQLKIQHAANKVFEEFLEGPISFPPTYKYNMDEDTYDRSEKCRVPAWTDRILWRRRKVTTIDRENKTFNSGKCLYYGRADIRCSDHRPVAALIECEVNKVVPKKQIEVLNRVMNELVPFQVILIVKTHTNIMNHMVKDECIRLFSQFKSFAMIREFKSSLYVTYSNGMYAYEAFAQLNNFHIEKYDITLLIKVENESHYQKLYEQELWDCLEVLYYARHDSLVSKEDEETTNFFDTNALTNLNEDAKSYNNEMSQFHAPSKIHSSMSIFREMNKGKTNDTLCAPHNPLFKALSNSNLNDYDPEIEKNTNIIKPAVKQIHSATNILDLSNDEIPGFDVLTTGLTNVQPPKRPPPPIPANFPFQQQQLKIETDTINTPKLVDFDETTDLSMGFDDDFSKLSIVSTKNADIVPTRPPPLPPMPKTSTTKPFFTLSSQNSLDNDDNNPFDVITATTLPPPLPPMPVHLISSANASSKSSLVLPPPLPPMPVKTINLDPFENPIKAASQPPPLPKRPSDLLNKKLDLFGNPVFNPTTPFDPFA